jgi:hypothetical protein
MDVFGAGEQRMLAARIVSPSVDERHVYLDYLAHLCTIWPDSGGFRLVH